MYNNIVVPLDGSDTAARALHPAAVLAHRVGATVTITSVVAPSFVSAATDRSRAQAAAADIHEPVIKLLVSSRAPAPHLLKALESDPDHLLCMASTGRSHLGQVMGSVAEELLRFRTGPFLLVGPVCEAENFSLSGPMLVPLDGSETGAEILPIAAEWVTGFGFTPSVVTVVESGSGAAAGVDFTPANEAAVPHNGSDDLSELTGAPTDWEVLHGPDVADAIVQHAKDSSASLIALTTHGRTGLARLLMGSVAMSIVHKAPCPVLIHRPLRLRA